MSLYPAAPLSWDCSFRPVALRPRLSAGFALYEYGAILPVVFIKLEEAADERQI